MTLEELTQKADKAKGIAEELKILERANPLLRDVRYKFFNFHNNAALCSDDMLKEILCEGRQVLIEKKKKELEHLLNARDTIKN